MAACGKLSPTPQNPYNPEPQILCGVDVDVEVPGVLNPKRCPGDLHPWQLPLRAAWDRGAAPRDSGAAAAAPVGGNPP